MLYSSQAYSTRSKQVKMVKVHYYHKFSFIGFTLGLFAMVFGITGLTTSHWISINHDQSSHPIVYDLFRQCYQNKTIQCVDIDSFRTPQYFQIGGFIVLITGIFIGVLCAAFISKYTIHFIAPCIIIIGTMLIFFGLISYVKCVVEKHTTSIIKLHLGYSIMFMTTTCVIGYILIAYFSFTAGYTHRHIIATANIY